MKRSQVKVSDDFHVLTCPHLRAPTLIDGDHLLSPQHLRVTLHTTQIPRSLGWQVDVDVSVNDE